MDDDLYKVVTVRCRECFHGGIAIFPHTLSIDDCPCPNCGKTNILEVFQVHSIDKPPSKFWKGRTGMSMLYESPVRSQTSSSEVVEQLLEEMDTK